MRTPVVVAAHSRTLGLDTLDFVAERYRRWEHGSPDPVAGNRHSLGSVVNRNHTRPWVQAPVVLPMRGFRPSPVEWFGWIPSLERDPVVLALSSCAPGYR